MTKLDDTESSLIEIDSHALHTITGGQNITSPEGSGGIDPTKPPGKLKKFVCGLTMLGCTWVGPEAPDPDDTRLGRPGGPPNGRPPVGAPATPGPTANPIVGLN